MTSLNKLYILTNARMAICIFLRTYIRKYVQRCPDDPSMDDHDVLVGLCF